MSEESFFAKIDQKEEPAEAGQRVIKTSEDKFFSHITPPDTVAVQSQSNINATQDITPDKEAEYYQLSKDTGAPISTIRLVPEQVKAKSLYKTSSDKSIQEYLSRSHTHAAISKDDTENLEKAKVSFGEKVRRSFQRGQRNVELGNLRAQQLFGDVSQETEDRIQQIKGALGDEVPFEPGGFVEKGFLQAVEQVPILTSTSLQGLERGLLGANVGAAGAAIAGQLGPQALAPEELVTVPTAAAIGFGIGFKGGSAEQIFKLEAGLAADEFLDFRDEEGQPLDPNILWAASVAVGGVNAGLEFASLKTLLKTVPGTEKLFGRFTTDKIKDVLKVPSVRKRLLDVGKKWGTAIGVEALTEASQEAVTIIGGELAKTLDEGAFEGIEISEATKRALMAGEAAIAPAAFFGAPGSIVGVYKSVKDVHDSNDFNDNIKKDRQSISETLTAQRSTDHAKEFIEAVGADSDVYVSSEGMKTLFQSHTKETTDALLNKIGVEPTKAQENMTAGTDTTIRAKEVLTLTDEEYNIIKDDIKPAPGAYTQREINEGSANEDIENLTKHIEEDVEKSNKINAEIERIQGEARKAGLTEEVSQNAPILMQGISNKLELEGVDQVEFLKKITLKKERFAAIKDLIDKGRQIFQSEIKEPGKVTDPRGLLTIEKEAYTISLFENADLSTVLHEVGHIALNEYSNLEIEGIASESLKQDMGVIREWVGAEAGQGFTTEQLETFARGFEAYLMEGKAPTSGLRAAFERFKRWLTETYKSVKGLNVKLNKDVRQVFDRMLSANIEVEASAVENGFIVKTKEEMNSLGMVKADQVFAARLMEQVKKKAGERLTKERNSGYRKNIRTWRAESAMEVKEENPAYETISLIVQDNNQINRAEYIERYGEESIALLPSQRILTRPTTVKGKRIILSDEGEVVLDTIRGEIEQGEAARKIAKRDEAGNVIGATVVGGTFPEYFKDKGLLKKETLEIIDKALAGERLTDRQLLILEDLSDGYRDQTARQLGVSPDEIFTESVFKTVTGAGKSVDEVAAFYEYPDANNMIEAFLNTPNRKVAIDQRTSEKIAAHDAQWQAEDFMVDLKEYRDYLDIMARYIGGRGVDTAVTSERIEKNRSRWQKEAAQEITDELPELTGQERQDAIDERVQRKIDNFKIQTARPSVVSKETLKRLARETMAAKTVREARRVDKFLSTMKKASSNERRAILREDWGEAARQNELARFNYEMAGLSVKIREEVDTILKRAKRIGKPKKKETVDLTHKEAILHLIDRYSLASLAPSEPQKLPDYAALFAGDNTSRNEDGPRTNDGFNDTDFLGSNVKDFRDLSTEHLRDLDNAIRYLERQGNLKRKDLLSDGETELKAVVGESKEIMDEVKSRKVWEKGSLMRRLTGISRKFFSRLDSLTFTAKSLDGYTNLGKEGKKGPVERFIIDRIKAAENALIVDQAAIKKQLDPHLNQISKTVRKWHKQFGNRITIEGAPVPDLMQRDGQTMGWKAENIFAVVLNTGNQGEASNYQNLLAGYEDLSPGAIEAIKDMLSVKDMDAVQGIWDAMESLFQQTNEQHVKIKNFNMAKVIATPFTFKGKEYRGGYYPIKHDRELSFIVDDRGNKTDLFESDEASFTTPYAKSGHTIKRIKGVALPILLDLSVVDAHFRDTLQYIHFSDAIRDADRITRDHDFRRSATRILGKDVYNTIRPALKHIANPKREGLDVAGARGVEWMRGLSTAYVLAWNTGVAIKQPLSTFGAIRDMGAKAYAQGFASTLMSPSTHYQKMLELSPYMKNRLTSFDRELRSQFLKLSAKQRGVYFGDTKVTWQDVKNFGFWQIRIADTATVLPIWHGAFNDKLNADQSNLQEAINYADDIVRNSQPSAAPLDLSSWQRDGGAIRLFSQFQTFTVGKYGQRQRLHYRAWRNGSISSLDYAWFNFMDAFVPLVAINLLQSILWGNDLGDEETQQEIMIDVLQSWAFMGVPIVSNVARSISRYGEPFDSPVFETANKAVRGVVSGVKGLNGFESKKERERALWGVAHATSILLGVPVSKIVQRAQRGAEQDKGVPGIKYLVPAPPNRK